MAHHREMPPSLVSTRQDWARPAWIPPEPESVLPDADISRSTRRAIGSVDTPAADHIPNARFVADARFSRRDPFSRGGRFFLDDLSPGDQFAATLKLGGQTWIPACARRGVRHGDGSASLRVHHGFLH